MWCTAVQQAMEVLETQCQAAVVSLSQQLRKARGAARWATSALQGMEAETARLNGEVVEGEKQLAELMKALETAKNKLAKAKEAPTPMRSVHALYVAEAEALEKKLAPQGGDACGGAAPESSLQSAKRKTQRCSRRKRDSVEDGGSEDAKQYKLDGAAMYDEASR